MTGAHTQQDTESNVATEDGIDREKVQRATRMLLEAIGENPGKAPLAETWQRRVPETLETLTEGMRKQEKPTLRTFPAETDELVVKTGIPVYSLCEHHMLPYHGVAHVAYRPEGEVVGLSKLPRYVRWQARRLTTQEKLTRDIATGLDTELETTAVLVEVTASHLCEAMRGVETETQTTTRATAGEPTEDDRRQFRRQIDS